MCRVVAVVLLILAAVPSFAQRHVDFFLDAEGVRRTGTNQDFTPGVTRYDPSFTEGGGLGGGVNWFFSDRVSLELKAAGLVSHLRVRTMGSDFVATADLGDAQIYPITALVQWHLLEHGTFRPWLGAGVGHFVIRNINERIGFAGTGIHFEDPTGFVVDAGTEVRMSKRFGLTADARYVPLETSARATIVGTPASVQMHVRPLIVGFGVVYHVGD